MRNFSKFHILVNLAGALAGLIVIVYVVRSSFYTEQIAACASRYTQGRRMGVESSAGVPMTPIELQARAGTNERGVLANASVVKVTGAPVPIVIQVALAKGASTQYQSEVARGGVSFSWRPAELNQSEGACLSYSVWMPLDFDYAAAGLLPGIFGGRPLDPMAPSDGKTGFAARMMWRKNGAGEVYAQVPGVSVGSGLAIEPGKFIFQRGQWNTIDQEVILNTPGQANGILRLWVNGELKIDHASMTWREDQKLKINGVQSDIAYGTLEGAVAAPKNTSIQVTPFLLRWK